MKPAASILLTSPYPPDRLFSIERFVHVLTQSLSSRITIRALAPRAVFRRLAPSASAAKWLGYLDKYLLFPRTLRSELRKTGAIVHFSDQGDAFYFRAKAFERALLTCHDVLAIRASRRELSEARVRFFGRVQQNVILAGLRAAPRIACVSHTTRTQLARLTGRDEGQFTVIPMALDPLFRPMRAESAEAIVSGFSVLTPFILHVGGTQWYKNRPGVLRIFREARTHLPEKTKLVLIGKALPPELERYIADEGLAGTVHCLSGCTDEDLRAFYSAAECLLFPSHYEGFGWPIIEAQACGCPVVTTNRAPMNETGGSAAVYIDPQDIPGSALLLGRLFREGPSAREQRVEAGFENVRRFSLDRMLNAYLEFYTEAGLRSPGAARTCLVGRGA